MFIRIPIILTIISTAIFAQRIDEFEKDLQQDEKENTDQVELFGDAPRFGRLEDFRKYQLINQAVHDNLNQDLVQKKAKTAQQQNNVLTTQNSNQVVVETKKHLAENSKEDPSKIPHSVAKVNDDADDVKDENSAFASGSKVHVKRKHTTSDAEKKHHNKQTSADNNFNNTSANDGKISKSSNTSSNNDNNDRKELVQETHKFFDFNSGADVMGERRNMPTNQYEVLQGGPGHAILYTSELLPHDTRHLETCKSEILNDDPPTANSSSHNATPAVPRIRHEDGHKNPKPQRLMHRAHRKGKNKAAANARRQPGKNTRPSQQSAAHGRAQQQSSKSDNSNNNNNNKRNVMSYFTKVFRQPTNQRTAGSLLNVHPVRHKTMINRDCGYGNEFDVSNRGRLMTKRDTLGDDWSQAAIHNAMLAAGYRRGDLLSMERAIRDLNREDVKFVQNLIPPVEGNKENAEQDPDEGEFNLDNAFDADDLSSEYVGLVNDKPERQRRMVLKRDGVEYFQNDGRESNEPSLGDDDVRQKSAKLFPKRDITPDDLFEPAEVIDTRYQLTQENINSYFPKMGNPLINYDAAVEGEDENKEETDDENVDYTNNLFNVRSVIEEEADLHGGGGTRSYLANIRNKNQQRMLQEKGEQRKIKR